MFVSAEDVMENAGGSAECQGGGFALWIEHYAVERNTFLPRERGAPGTARQCVGEVVPSAVCVIAPGAEEYVTLEGRRVGTRGLQRPAQWLRQTAGAQ
jgi:hypothetical protein